MYEPKIGDWVQAPNSPVCPTWVGQVVDIHPPTAAVIFPNTYTRANSTSWRMVFDISDLVKIEHAVVVSDAENFDVRR